MIQIPVEIGDVILTGKFKNHKVTVEEIGTDDYGLPTVNGKGIMKIRVEKLMPKKIKESTMRKINEATAVNSPKVQKVVDEINKIIESAIDSDGDKIAVVDTSGTWQEPYIYEPIQYKNGALKITYYSVYNQKKPQVDVILKRHMEEDGIPTLRHILKMYKKAIKQAGKPTRESIVNEGKSTFVKDRNLPSVLKDSGLTFEEFKEYEDSLLSKKVSELRKLQGLVRQQQDSLVKKNPDPNKWPDHVKRADKQLRFRDQMLMAAVDHVAFGENKVTSKMKLSEVISKGVFITIKKEDGKFWFYVDDECISNVGFPTKEAAEHAALTKGFNVEKGGDAEDEMPKTVEVPKPSKREKTPKTEKPKEIDLGKAKEIKEHVMKIVVEELNRAIQKKKPLSEAVKITKKIEAALTELKDLQDILAKANAEIEAIKKKFDMSSIQKKADEILKEQLWDFLEELKKDETKIVKLKGIILKINRHQASPATYEYEKVLDFVMTQVNQDVKAKILAELKAVEKIGKTKANVSFTTEAVGGVWNTIVNFLSGLIPALKNKGKKIDNDIAKAEAQLANIQ